ncbi:MAG: lactate racemase domain-containing protein [Planctomycetota bacterium]
MSFPEELHLASGPVSASVAASEHAMMITPRAESVSITELCRRSLAEPLGYPEVTRCVVPGDRIVVAVDPETPFVIELICAVCEQLQTIPDGGVQLTLLLPDDPSKEGWSWLMEQLPVHILEQLTVHIHNPADQASISYLASSANGERIYLNQLLTDADLIVSVGFIAFDSLLGFRGTSSSLFPAFSDLQTRQGHHSQGHPELSPDQQRVYRELVDEVGWLLGTQFTIQVVPGTASHPAAILCGMPDVVMERGRELVNEIWRVSLEEPVDAIVLTVPGGTPFGWKQLGQALEQASSMVLQGGRIIAIADLPEPQGPAAALLRRSQEPDELLKPLRREPTTDSIEIAQLIQAQRRARVYLLSRLSPEVVEELGMIPIASSEELRRLVATFTNCRIIPFANYSWCSVDD